LLKDVVSAGILNSGFFQNVCKWVLDRDPKAHLFTLSNCYKDIGYYNAMVDATGQTSMAYGFRIVEDLIEGTRIWMEQKGYSSLDEFVGRAVPNVTDWQYLNLNYVVKARIDQDSCIKCGRCHIACEDTSHQAITDTKDGVRYFEVIDEECVGCNLCASVCPVENCITMVQMTDGVDPRTGKPIDPDYANWTTHPNNPNSVAAE